MFSNQHELSHLHTKKNSFELSLTDLERLDRYKPA